MHELNSGVRRQCIREKHKGRLQAWVKDLTNY